MAVFSDSDNSRIRAVRRLAGFFFARFFAILEAGRRLRCLSGKARLAASHGKCTFMAEDYPKDSDGGR
jgi:hypothetical protein